MVPTLSDEREESPPRMIEEAGPDWERERAELKHFIAHRLHEYRAHTDEDTLDSCAQEALVQLYLWRRREIAAGRPIRSLEAMKNRIARFTAVNHIRRSIQEGRHQPIDEEVSSLPVRPAPKFVEAATRLRFFLVSFLARERPELVDVAELRIDGLPWAEVAERLGLPAGLVKVRYSRALQEFRAFLAEHPEAEDWVFEEGS